MVISRFTGRGRFQFRLATLLLLVAVVAVLLWLAREYQFVLARREAIAGKYSVLSVYIATPSDQLHEPAFGWPSIPFWRRMLGDEPVTAVRLYGVGPTSEDALIVRELVPEAFLCSFGTQNRPDWTREPRRVHWLSLCR